MDNYLEVVTASAADFPAIRQIAHETWPITYGPILSAAQLQYMLDLFYSDKGLAQNIADGHLFLLVVENGTPLGFASYVNHFNNSNTTRIPKIYIFPETQGKGLGRLLISEIEKRALLVHDAHLSLNVNRYNKAIKFYKKMGFEIVKEEDIELDFGYLMEDYVMEKNISPQL